MASNEPVDYSSLTDAQKQEFDQLSRGSIGSTANLALQGSVMHDPYARVTRDPNSTVRADMAGIQQNLASSPMRAARAMGAQPGGWGELAGAAGSGALNFATSALGTPEGMAISMGLPMLRAGAGLLPKLPMPNVLQTLGLGAIGGTAAGATGGSVMGGVGEGMTAGATAGIFKRISDHFAQTKEDALNLGKAVVKEVPWLNQLIPQGAKDTGAGQIAPLMLIRDPQVGQALMSYKYQQLTNKVADAVGKDAIVDIPALNASTAKDVLKRISGGGAGQKIDNSTAQFVADYAQKNGMFEKKAMTIERALDEVLVQKALARSAPDGATGHMARARAEQIQNEVDALVKAKGGADLLSEYQDGRTQYGKWMAIAGDKEHNILKDSGVFEMNLKGGKLNMGKLAEYIGQHIDEYGPTKFPEFYGAANRLGQLGSKDVTTNMRIPRLYGHGISEGMGGIKFNRPTGTLGAPQMGNPMAGLAPGEMSLMPPEYIFQQPADQRPLGQ